MEEQINSTGYKADTVRFEKRISRVSQYGNNGKHLRVVVPISIVDCFGIDKNSGIVWSRFGDKILLEVV